MTNVTLYIKDIGEFEPVGDSTQWPESGVYIKDGTVYFVDVNIGVYAIPESIFNIGGVA